MVFPNYFSISGDKRPSSASKGQPGGKAAKTSKKSKTQVLSEDSSEESSDDGAVIDNWTWISEYWPVGKDNFCL